MIDDDAVLNATRPKDNEEEWIEVERNSDSQRSSNRVRL